MSQCPTCDREIGRARSCPCGWKAEREHHTEPPRTTCAYPTCQEPAICKVRISPGQNNWLNVCNEHYRWGARQRLDRPPAPPHPGVKLRPKDAPTSLQNQLAHLDTGREPGSDC